MGTWQRSALNFLFCHTQIDAWNSWPRHCVLYIDGLCHAGYRLTLLVDVSNCISFVFNVLSGRERAMRCANETLTIVLLHVAWQRFLLFKKRVRNGPELWAWCHGYVSNHLHDRCCEMSLWEMLCVCVVTCERVHSCAKKTKQKVRERKVKMVYSQVVQSIVPQICK